MVPSCSVNVRGQNSSAAAAAARAAFSRVSRRNRPTGPVVGMRPTVREGLGPGGGRRSSRCRRPRRLRGCRGARSRGCARGGRGGRASRPPAAFALLPRARLARTGRLRGRSCARPSQRAGDERGRRRCGGRCLYAGRYGGRAWSGGAGVHRRRITASRYENGISMRGTKGSRTSSVEPPRRHPRATDTDRGPLQALGRRDGRPRFARADPDQHYRSPRRTRCRPHNVSRHEPAPLSPVSDFFMLSHTATPSNRPGRREEWSRTMIRRPRSPPLHRTKVLRRSARAAPAGHRGGGAI